MMQRPILSSVIIISCLFALSAPALASNQLELKDGKVLQGKVLAVGPSRVLFEGDEDGQAVQFLERSQIKAYRSAKGSAIKLSADGQADPVGWVRTLSGSVRVRRAGREIGLSMSSSLGIIREKDELRTGPYARVSFLAPDGGVVFARDAVVRFRAGTAQLVDGTLRLENTSGRSRVLIPEGRLTVIKGRVEVSHLNSKGKSQVVTLAGRSVFSAKVGYRIELPRNHAMDLKAAQARQPASVAASNTNGWALRLEYGAMQVKVQPGERILLLGSPLPRKAPLTQPTPKPAERRPAQPGPNLQAGNVVRATSSFVLYRRGEAARRITRAEARNFALSAGDAVESGQGEVYLQSGSTRLRLGKGGRLVASPLEGGPPFRLLGGEAVLETHKQTSLILPGGELGLLNGRASVSASKTQLKIAVVQGTGGARFGNAVRAELLPKSEILVKSKPGRVGLEVPTGALPVPVSLGGLDLVLKAGRKTSYARTGSLEVVTLNGTRLELVGGVRCKIASGANETKQLVLADGRRFQLGKGTFRFAREGQQIVAKGLPKGSKAQPAPAVAKKRTPTLRAGQKEHKLSNGAVVVAKNWGPLQIKYRAAPYVVVEGPYGPLWLGPKTRVTLSRKNRLARIDLDDGRYVVHEPGGSRFTFKLDQDGKLRVEVHSGWRVLEVEAGLEFDLTLRRGNYVLTYVFGQAFYLEPGRKMEVTQKQGLKTYMARKRER